MLVVPLWGSILPIRAQCSSVRTVVVPAATTRRPSWSARLDLQSRFRGQRIPFGVEANLCHLRHPDWLEGAQPDMEGQVGDENASGADSLQDGRGEVQPGSGCGDGTALPGKDGLVALPIERLVRAANVWGQGNMPQNFKPGKEILHRREAKEAFAELSYGCDRGLQELAPSGAAKASS